MSYEFKILADTSDELRQSLLDLIGLIQSDQSDVAVNSARGELPELLAEVRRRLAHDGYVLRVVKASGDDLTAKTPEDAGVVEEPEDAGVVEEPAELTGEEKPKRRRRTKAEMEAARAALAGGGEEPKPTETIEWTDPEPEPEEDFGLVEEEPELSEKELAALKKETIRKLMAINKEPGGPARIKSLLSAYKDDEGKQMLVAAIPPKFFPQIAKALEA